MSKSLLLSRFTSTMQVVGHCGNGGGQSIGAWPQEKLVHIKMSSACDTNLANIISLVACTGYIIDTHWVKLINCSTVFHVLIVVC
jgi:hypothetical protein